MNKIGLSILAVAATLAEPSGAHAPDGDLQSPSQGGALSASACDALPSAMPGWPYYLIWDYDDYAEPFVLGRGTVTEDYFYYDRPFRQGVLGANLRVETNEYDAVPTAVLMGRALAAVPRVLSQQLPPIRLEIAGHYANAQFLRGFFPDSYTVAGQQFVENLVAASVRVRSAIVCPRTTAGARCIRRCAACPRGSRADQRTARLPPCWG